MNDVIANSWPASACDLAVTKRAISKSFAPITLVMLVTAAVYVGTCAWPVILDETDGQYAGAAREMLERGDWLVPTNNGVPRLQKPPLVYWLTMASMKVFGVNEFAARLPNALATVAWVFATYLIGKWIGGERRGVIAATVHGSMMGLFLFTHRIMPEPFLATCITLTIWCFLNAQVEPGSEGKSGGGPPHSKTCRKHERGLTSRKRLGVRWPSSAFGPIHQARAALSEGSESPDSNCYEGTERRARKWFFWAWVCMGVGVLSKGLHGALWPLLVVGVSAILQPRTRSTWKGLLSFPGIVAFLAITMPWYVLMARRFPGFLGYHFFNEQAGHAFNMHTPRDCEQVPLITFWAQHILYLFPWIFLLPALLVTRLKRAHKSASAGEKLLWIWIAVTAVTISFSARQDHYSMTCWGAVAVCLAFPLAEIGGIHRTKWLMPPAFAMVVAGCLIIGAAMELNHPVVATATQVQPEAARDDIHSAIRGLSAETWCECGPLAIAAAAALLAGGALAGYLLIGGRTLPATFLLAGTMALVFPLAMRGYAQIQEYFSLADAAKTINAQAAPDALIACEGEPHLSASLFFYLNRQVSWTGRQTGSVVAAEAHGIPVGPFVSDETLADAWRSDRQVFFILEESDLAKWKPRLEGDANKLSILARDGTRVLIGNQKQGEFAIGGGG